MADLFYFGVTPQTASQSVREAFQVGTDHHREMLARLERVAIGRMIVSTCERLEVYAVTDQHQPDAWHRRLAEWFHLHESVVASSARILHGADVARHLLRLTAGLESRILGEPQVLGQVRAAHVLATKAGALDPVLSALGRAAIHAGKRVRHETRINRRETSIAHLAVDHIASSVKPDEGKSIIVIGTGALASDVLHRLASRFAGRLVVAGRNAKRTNALAKAHGARAVDLDSVPARLTSADAVVTCTSAPHHVLNAMSFRAGVNSPLVLVDLSVPRNIDPDLARVPGVQLVDLEDLLRRHRNGSHALPQASDIVEAELARFLCWQRERRIAPVIARLLRTLGQGGEHLPRTIKRQLHARIMRLKQEVAA